MNLDLNKDQAVDALTALLLLKVRKILIIMNNWWQQEPVDVFKFKWISFMEWARPIHNGMNERRKLTLFSLTSGLLTGCPGERGQIDPFPLYFLIVKFKCEKHFYNVNIYSRKTENVQIPCEGVCSKFLNKNCAICLLSEGFPKSFKMAKSNAGSMSKYRFSLA